MEEVLTPKEAVCLILKLQMPKLRSAFESMFQSLQLLQTCTLNLFEHFK